MTAAMTTPYDPVHAVVDALRDAGCHVQASGRDRYTAQCPAHEDRDPSLSVGRGTRGEPKAVVHCHAGCAVGDILAALGMEPGALFADWTPAGTGSVSYLHHVRAWTPPAEQRPKPSPYRREKVAHYDYVWPDGTPCARVVKFHKVDPDTGEVVGKTFTQQRWDVEQSTYLSGLDGLDVPLYHADRVAAAVQRGEPILVCEGEKDADNATDAWGITATCNPMGAGSWRPHHSDALAGAVVIVCADNDNAGRAHAHKVRTDLAERATVVLRMPAEGNDLTDHLQAGLGLGDLIEVPWDDEAPPPAESLDEQAEDFAYQQAVARRAAELRLNEDARRLLAAEAVGQAAPLQAVALDKFLSEPDEDVAYRVSELWPKDGRVLLAAAAKAGKTTLTVNLLRGLADGGDLLGYEVQPVERSAVYLNLEVSARQMRAWLRQAGIVHPERVHVVNLRGAISSLTLSTEQGRRRVADWLASLDAEVVILDPLAPLLASLGLDENSNAEVATFFGWWSETLHLAGVSDDFICHHAGHAGGRSRGASRLMDEPDALWTITRDSALDEEEDSIYAGVEPRFFRATGRDVEVAEQPLVFDPVTRLLSLGEGNRKALRQAAQDGAAKARVLAAIEQGHSTQRTIRSAAGGNERQNIRALELLVEDGTLECVKVGQAYHYTLIRTPFEQPVPSGAGTGLAPVAPVGGAHLYRGTTTPVGEHHPRCRSCSAPLEHRGAVYCPTCADRRRAGEDI